MVYAVRLRSQIQLFPLEINCTPRVIPIISAFSLSHMAPTRTRRHRRRYAPPASLECLRRYIAADFAQYAAMAKETVLENRITLVESKQKENADRVASTVKRIEDLRSQLLGGSSIAVSTVGELERVHRLIQYSRGYGGRIIVAPGVSAETRKELNDLSVKWTIHLD